VPEYVKGYLHDLLNRCWQSNPGTRPTFREILDFFLANLAPCRELEDELEDVRKIFSEIEPFWREFLEVLEM
jgi:hypothetical protein